MKPERYRIIRAIASLISNWWYVDQVRVSPREGLLLRLQPPCSLLVRSQRAHIVGRRIDANHPQPNVIYDCTTEHNQARATLTVKLLDQAGTLHILWADSRQTQVLQPADLDLYG